MNEGIYSPHVLAGFVLGNFLRTTGPYLLIKLRALWFRQPCSFDVAYLKEAVILSLTLAGAGGFFLPQVTVGWPPLAQALVAAGIAYVGQDLWRKLWPLLQALGLVPRGITLPEPTPEPDPDPAPPAEPES